MANLDPQQQASSVGGHWFTTTHWSVVLAARQNNSPAGEAALEQLCRTYWYPLYAYIRRQGHSPHDAQDLTQEFLARLLAKDFLQNVAAEKGKFRSFLLVSLKNFLANERDRALAAKRGGGKQILSWDELTPEARYQLEPACSSTAAELYDRHWAWTILEQALENLFKELQASGKEAQFQHLKIFLEREAEFGDYAKIARAMNTTSAAVAMAVSRLRQRYRELVRLEIAHTIADESEMNDEMQYLFAIVGGHERES